MKRLALLLGIVLLTTVGFAAFGTVGRRAAPIAPPPIAPLPPPSPPGGDWAGLRAAQSSLGLLNGNVAEYDRTIHSPNAVGDAVRMSAELSNRFVAAPGSSDLFLEVLLNARERPALERREPLNIAFVIDKSGSMAERGKLDYVKAAVEHSIRQLGSDDIVSLIAFDTTARVVAPAMRARDKTALLAAVAGLHAGGTTALADGLQLGFAEARRFAERGFISRLVLLSDGLANVGVVEPGELRRIVGGCLERGVSLTAIGVGRDFSETMMSGLAEAGSGNYWYIGDAEEIPAVYAKEFAGLAGVVAENIAVTATALNGFEVVEAYGYDWRTTPTGATISLAALAAGEKRSIVLRLRAPRGDPGTVRIADVTLSYDDAPAGKGRQTFAQALAIERTNDPTQIEAGIHPRIAARTLLLKGAKTMADSARLLNDGRRDEAQRVLRDAVAERRNLNKVLRNPAVAAQIRYFDAHLADDAAVGAMAPAAAASAARDQSLSRHAYEKQMEK